MRTPSTSRALVLVAVLVLAGIGIDLRMPSEATSAPDPAVAGPAVAGAWYCAAGETDEEHRLDVVAATPPGNGVSQIELVPMAGGAASPATQRRVFAGAATTFTAPAGSSAAAIAARWWDRPTAVSRTWTVGGVDDPPGLVSGPCTNQPSPTWYVPGMSTAGGATARLYLYNPFGVDASVSVSFTTGTGLVAPILLENVSIPARDIVSVNLNDHVPREADVGVAVESRAGRVVVEGVQYLNAAIGNVDAVSLVRASQELAETWTVPWSVTDPGLEPEVPEDATDEEVAAPEGDAVVDGAVAAQEAPTDDPTDSSTDDATDAPTDAVTEAPTTAPEPESTTAPDVLTPPAPGPDGLTVVETAAPGSGTASWVWVSNPGDEDAAVTYALHTRDGVVVPDVGGEVLVRAGHVIRLDLRQALPDPIATAGVTVRSENGVPVAVSVGSLVRPEVGDVAQTGFATTLGSPVASQEWLAIGEPIADRTQVLHVVNVGAEAVTVDVAVWNGSVVRRPAGLTGVPVPAGAMVELALTGAAFPVTEVVAHVTASGPVVVGRHSVGPSGTGGWVSSGAIPASVWEGGSTIPAVAHRTRLAEELGTDQGVPTTDEQIVDLPADADEPAPEATDEVTTP